MSGGIVGGAVWATVWLVKGSKDGLVVGREECAKAGFSVADVGTGVTTRDKVGEPVGELVE